MPRADGRLPTQRRSFRRGPTSKAVHSRAAFRLKLAVIHQSAVRFHWKKRTLCLPIEQRQFRPISAFRCSASAGTSQLDRQPERGRRLSNGGHPNRKKLSAAALNLLVQKGLGDQRVTALDLGAQVYAMSCPRSKDAGAKATGALMPGDHTFKSRDQYGWRAWLNLDNQTRKAR